MKKFLVFAAAATTLFAACNKTKVVYDNDPQEIAMFAVSNVATKAPVTGTDFLAGDNMRVSAYLAATDANNADKVGHYFNNVLFSKGSDTWVGGQYWPLSAATLNFVAVTQIGGGVEEADISYDEGTDAFTVVLNANHESIVSQPDVMYATGRGANTPGSSTVAPVDMVFKHALAWVNFSFKSNVKTAGTLVVNTVKLTTRYNGTFTVTPQNFTNPSAGLSAIVDWTMKDDAFGIAVPNTDNTAEMAHMDMNGLDDYTAFGNGLLVVPMTAEDTVDPYFVITYTVKQSDGDKTYTYKHVLKDQVWEAAKKYTFNINITLKEIEVDPEVEEWEEETGLTAWLGAN